MGSVRLTEYIFAVWRQVGSLLDMLVSAQAPLAVAEP